MFTVILQINIAVIISREKRLIISTFSFLNFYFSLFLFSDFLFRRFPFRRLPFRYFPFSIFFQNFSLSLFSFSLFSTNPHGLYDTLHVSVQTDDRKDHEIYCWWKASVGDLLLHFFRNSLQYAENSVKWL